MTLKRIRLRTTKNSTRINSSTIIPAANEFGTEVREVERCASVTVSKSASNNIEQVAVCGS
jgi:hypothetical protein